MFFSVAVALAASCIYAHAVPLKAESTKKIATLSTGRQASSRSLPLQVDELTSFKGKDHLNKRYSTGLRQSIKNVWYVDVQVGTPPKGFKVAVDSTSPDLFLSGSFCGSNCAGNAIYNSNLSSTAVVDSTYDVSWSGSEVPPSLQGTVVTDTVVDFAALGSVANYKFGEANEWVDIFPYYTPSGERYDGYVGLGFNTGTILGGSNLVQSIAAQSKVDAVLGLDLNRKQLSIGVNKSLYTGDFSFLPVISGTGSWVTRIDAIFSGNTSVPLDADPGALFLLTISATFAPNTVVSQIYASLGGWETSYDGYFHYYNYPCNPDPDVGLTFAGRQFYILPSLLASGPPVNGTCSGSIFGFDGTGPVIVGGNFLQSVYVKADYDKTTIGFADLRW